MACPATRTRDFLSMVTVLGSERNSVTLLTVIVIDPPTIPATDAALEVRGNSDVDKGAGAAVAVVTADMVKVFSDVEAKVVGGTLTVETTVVGGGGTLTVVADAGVRVGTLLVGI
mmetsp:Transcript_125345/g.244081  ORF Transcript_125345/g.244081 Transcript_125345/m.244081 type:complete len:115 (-) Transcript_125345:1119-1463(-)